MAMFPVHAERGFSTVKEFGVYMLCLVLIVLALAGIVFLIERVF